MRSIFDAANICETPYANSFDLNIAIESRISTNTRMKVRVRYL
jgi:hypothetical protein